MVCSDAHSRHHLLPYKKRMSIWEVWNHRFQKITLVLWTQGFLCWKWAQYQCRKKWKGREIEESITPQKRQKEATKWPIHFLEDVFLSSNTLHDMSPSLSIASKTFLILFVSYGGMSVGLSSFIWWAVQCSHHCLCPWVWNVSMSNGPCCDL